MDKKDKLSANNTSSSSVQKRSQNAGSTRKTTKSKKKRIKLDPTTNKLIGVFVFALGVASIMAVSYLALVKMGYIGSEEQQNQVHEAVPVQEQVSEAQRAALEQHITIARTAELSSVTQTQVNQLGLQKAAPDVFQKTWVARHRIMTALSDFRKDGSFEIILFTDRDGYERRYARGQYNYDEEHGILTMQAGHDPIPRIDGVRMRVLTRSTFSVVLLQKGNQLIWVPHILEGHRNQVHPLFTFFEAQSSYIEWSEDQR